MERRRGGERWEPACKPGSVADSHSSGMHVAVHLERPTREPVRAARRGSKPLVPLFGLAPGGVYPATDVTTGAVRSYRTISPLPNRHQRCLGGMFSVALSVGSRPPGVTWHPALRSPDFPPPRSGRGSDCPADSQVESLSCLLPLNISPQCTPLVPHSRTSLKGRPKITREPA